MKRSSMGRTSQLLSVGFLIFFTGMAQAAKLPSLCWALFPMETARVGFFPRMESELIQAYELGGAQAARLIRQSPFTPIRMAATAKTWYTIARGPSGKWLRFGFELGDQDKTVFGTSVHFLSREAANEFLQQAPLRAESACLPVYLSVNAFESLEANEQSDDLLNAMKNPPLSVVTLAVGAQVTWNVHVRNDLEVVLRGRRTLRGILVEQISSVKANVRAEPVEIMKLVKKVSIKQDLYQTTRVSSSTLDKIPHAFLQSPLLPLQSETRQGHFASVLVIDGVPVGIAFVVRGDTAQVKEVKIAPSDYVTAFMSATPLRTSGPVSFQFSEIALRDLKIHAFSAEKVVQSLDRLESEPFPHPQVYGSFIALGRDASGSRYIFEFDRKNAGEFDIIHVQPFAIKTALNLKLVELKRAEFKATRGAYVGVSFALSLHVQSGMVDMDLDFEDVQAMISQVKSRAILKRPPRQVDSIAKAEAFYELIVPFKERYVQLTWSQPNGINEIISVRWTTRAAYATSRGGRL